MKPRNEQEDFNRALAATAHGVDLTVHVDDDMVRLGVPAEMLDHVIAFVKEGLDAHGYIGYTNRLEQVRKMLSAENVEALITFTRDQILEVLHRHRQIPPYEMSSGVAPY